MKSGEWRWTNDHRPGGCSARRAVAVRVSQGDAGPLSGSGSRCAATGAAVRPVTKPPGVQASGSAGGQSFDRTPPWMTTFSRNFA